MKKTAVAIGIIVALLSGGVYAGSKMIASTGTEAGEKTVGKEVTSTERFSNNSELLNYSKRVEVVSTLNTIQIGQEMKAVFSENATTGYVWQIQTEGRAKAIGYSFEVLKQEEQPKVLLVGGGIQKVLTVKGEKKGLVKLTMTLKRPWEKAKSPIQTVEYLIEVK